MYQKIVIVGNLGRDPELRYTPSGQAVANINVATNHQYTNQAGDKVKTTTWFRVSAWGRQAEVVNQYLKSGSKVLVEGRLVSDDNGGPRIWTREDGSPAASFEINASTVRFLSSANGGSETEAPEEPTEPEDIPF